jgi:holo-[acyl-carrier protein] synthase
MATQAEPSMIVGIDLVSVSEIAASVARFGRRFLDRIYTGGELAYCLSESQVASVRLAARFAAKEAARKVLRLNDEAISWRSIEVQRQPAGWCDLVLHGEAAALAQSAGFVGFSVSLTHEASYASAVVLGEVARRGTNSAFVPGHGGGNG